LSDPPADVSAEDVEKENNDWADYLVCTTGTNSSGAGTTTVTD